ncbi:MAG: hypothetical protein HC819_11760 [Cyclobacteriaceae bacterium]|nr:hypothetical protein [Cyclobacteriaceae bacterium]
MKKIFTNRLLQSLVIALMATSHLTAQDPAIYWSFDQHKGTTATDGGSTTTKAGNLLNGLTFDVYATLGISGNALALSENTNAYVRFDGNMYFDDGPITMSAWVKSPGNGGQDMFALSLTDKNHWNIFMRLGISSTGKIIAQKRKEGNWGGGIADEASPYLFDDQWHMITAVFADYSTIMLYVDGLAVDTIVSASPVGKIYPKAFAAGTLLTSDVRSEDFNKHTVNGLLDEVRLYNAGLSAAAIKQLYDDDKALKIIAIANEGGTITPEGNVLLNPGDNETFMISPNFAQQIDDVMVDGVSVGAVTEYNFTNVTSSSIIEVFFETESYEVTVSTVDQLVDAVNNGAEGLIINVVAGTYSLDSTQQLRPKSNMVILGAGAESTIMEAASAWNPGTVGLPINEEDVNAVNKSPYLFRIENKQGVVLSDLKLTGSKIHGGVFANNCTNLRLKNLYFDDFSWSAIQTYNIDTFSVHDSRFIDAGGMVTHKGAAVFNNGTSHGEFYNNYISRTGNKQFVGFKAFGGSNQRIHHNTVDIDDDFSIEYMHANNKHIEIDHNVFSRTLSIPKGGGGGPVLAEGEYSFHIHHNWMKRSYGIELPRNSLSVHHNLIDCKTDADGGNFMSDFSDGQIVQGPIEFYNNLFKNPGRGIFWTREGNSYFDFRFHNNHVIANRTITPRTEGFFSFPESSDFRGIRLKDNIIECVGLNRPLVRSDWSLRLILRIMNSSMYRTPQAIQIRPQVSRRVLLTICTSPVAITMNFW